MLKIELAALFARPEISEMDDADYTSIVTALFSQFYVFGSHFRRV